VAGGNLFDAQTRLAIECSDIHLVRVQFAATKTVKSVPAVLAAHDSRLRPNHCARLGDPQ
jgi:hypothetical protein